MVGYVANLTQCEAVEEIRNELADTEFDEDVFSALLQWLQSSKFPWFKTRFCELIVERIERETQDLDEQIQSYDFQDPKKFLEILPPSKQEIIDLPTHVCISSV